MTFTSNIRIINSHNSSQENVYGVAIMIYAQFTWTW